jgi:hypothetical protein
MVRAMGGWLVSASVVSVVSVLAGCAGFTSSIRTSERYDPSSAYIYGRFSLETLEGRRPGGTMGFAIRCRDGATYTIELAADHPLQVIKVAPSVCQIDEFVYTGGGSVLGRRMATFRLLRNEFLDPGGVYYVGDFTAVSTSSAKHYLLYVEHRYAWAISQIRDNYARTTAEMKRTFAGLASARTEDRMSR